MAKPGAIFEVVFQGIFPEKIPLGTLSRTLSAIQRLASGADVATEEDDQEAENVSPAGDQIQLLDVRRGSAVYRFAGESADQIVPRLRLIGEVLAHPEKLGENDYLLGPLERISLSAKSLDCEVTVRKPGRSGAVLARIGPTSFDEISRSVFLRGDTTIVGRVQRVGGATEMRCALRVPFQQRLLFCRVDSQDVARKLGDCLYKQVSVYGNARWIRDTWRMHSFTIASAEEFKSGSVIDAFKAIYEAGGNGWDNVEDPARVLEEVSGK